MHSTFRKAIPEISRSGRGHPLHHERNVVAGHAEVVTHFERLPRALQRALNYRTHLGRPDDCHASSRLRQQAVHIEVQAYAIELPFMTLDVIQAAKKTVLFARKENEPQRTPKAV